MNAIHVSEPASHIPDDPSDASPIRCHHRWPSGRRCRQASEDGNSSFCATHAAVEQNRHNGDRLHALLQDDNVLLTASEINKSLASLYFLLAADKISPRRAAVLAYISSLMLRSLPAVEKEESPEAPGLILDLPRPQSPEPEPAAVVAGLQTRATSPSEAVIPSLPAAGRPAPVAAIAAAPATPVVIPSETRDLLFSPSHPPTAASPSPPKPQSYPIYRDPNYDDHWHPTRMGSPADKADPSLPSLRLRSGQAG